MLTLSPSVIAPVCHVGDRLEVTCNSTIATFLRWRISLLDEQQQDRNIERNINSDDLGAQTSNNTVNFTSFKFTRTSTQGVSPLVSKLTIINVTNNLNGTRVYCEEVDGSMSAYFTTIIVVVTGNSKSLYMHACLSHVIFCCPYIILFQKTGTVFHVHCYKADKMVSQCTPFQWGHCK